jgi:hypothetical protein
MLFVIGDSHVRSFSYNKKVFPIFVAQGSQLLLNTNKQCEKTVKLLKPILESLPLNNTVVLLIGEPSLREFLTEGSILTEVNPDNYASHFYQNLKWIKKNLTSTSRDIIIVPPIPRGDKDYGYLWLSVIQEMNKAGEHFANIYSSAVNENGALNELYIGDFIHSNEKLADLIVNTLQSGFAFSDDHHAWKYQYSLFGSSKVWGGVPMSTLRYEGRSSRNWQEILSTTIDTKMICSFLNLYFQLFDNSGNRWPDLHVKTEDEGFIALNIERCNMFFLSSELRKKRFDILQNILSLTSSLSKNDKFFDKELVRDNAVLVTTNIDILLTNISRYALVFCIIPADQNLIKDDLASRVVVLKFGSQFLCILTKSILDSYVLVLVAHSYKLLNNFRKISIRFKEKIKND